MKKIVIGLMAVATLMVSCKNESKDSEATEEKAVETVELQNAINKKGEFTLRGEFIYTDEAAVLKGNDFIYGVQLDEKAKELAEKVKPLKREDYDMVPVILKGKVKNNPDKDGWEKIVEIKEIIKVEKPTAEPAIKVKGE
ncbi:MULTISPECIES: hypothetical protein [Mesonia]|uniref:Uncharacterized protein n=1 Tax=Mesonia oceanica TaxID=2687242 RepID=A0AC61Y8C4_9FLAO|nr:MULTISPECIES: hypothetical protein [Mesonia]MAN27616.1 hypothetical protein [Mesonia sp.]MAQ40221.1 hypothetical protein [Mesonia sp.]MBJ97131.1 hypothetical protein [Flavobacteriaceae bacterium]VVV00648.1 hypothetical protein FVB9532_01921 [Mesonia oceanica]|tara:strand:+ start:9729 stop:10148 length:420 start_codon:yes stop_codon:yes gene_type:complete